MVSRALRRSHRPVWDPDAFANSYLFLEEAVADVLGTHSYAPLRDFTVCEEPEPEEPASEVTPHGSESRTTTPKVQRDGYWLTPIEAKFYDELRETDLSFSVQTTIHSASKARRPDFVVYPGGRPLIVELDGHEFHKSRQQRTADAQKERWLMARGLETIRFTGTEVWADPQACIRELRDLISQRSNSS